MKRVLVIEDDKDIVELVRYNLEKDGYQSLLITKAVREDGGRVKGAVIGP